jgi:hypothetical protein
MVLLCAGAAPSEPTSHLALVRRIPSRHVWSTMSSSNISALDNNPSAFDNGPGNALHSGVASANRSRDCNGGSSMLAGPGGAFSTMSDGPDRQGGRSAYFDPVTAELQQAHAYQLGPPSLIEEHPAEQSSVYSSDDELPVSMQSPVSCASPLEQCAVHYVQRRHFLPAGPIPEGVGYPPQQLPPDPYAQRRASFSGPGAPPPGLPQPPRLQPDAYVSARHSQPPPPAPVQGVPHHHPYAQPTNGHAHRSSRATNGSFGAGNGMASDYDTGNGTMPRMPSAQLKLPAGQPRQPADTVGENVRALL